MQTATAAPSCRSRRAARAGADSACGSRSGRRRARGRAAARTSGRGARSYASVEAAARRGERSLELAERDALLLLVAGDRVAARPESSASSASPAREQLEPLVVEAGARRERERAELVAVAVAGQHGEPRLRRAQRQLLALAKVIARGEDRVLQRVLAARRARPRRFRPRRSCAAGRGARARRRASASSASRSASSCSAVKRSR